LQDEEAKTGQRDERLKLDLSQSFACQGIAHQKNSTWEFFFVGTDQSVADTLGEKRQNLVRRQKNGRKNKRSKAKKGVETSNT